MPLPSILDLNPIELDTEQKRSKSKNANVGYGQKGIFFANAFADVSFKVICTDADASIVKKTAKGKTMFSVPEVDAKLKSNIVKDKISVTSDLKKAVAQSDIIVIAITAKVEGQKKNDYFSLVNTCKQIGAALRQGVLVIYGSVSGLGFIECTIKELLENTSGFKVGKDFGLAYSPILNTAVSSETLMLQVAATDPISLRAATTKLKTITNHIQEIGDLKTAETAALFAAAKQYTATALTNELAMFCEKANIDYFKVLEIISLNDPSFRPSITEEENKETKLLLDFAENLNVKLKLVALAKQINEDMIKHAVNLTNEGLRSCGKTFRRSKISVLGNLNQDGSKFVKLLEKKGANVVAYNPTAKKKARDFKSIKTNLIDSIEGADCIVILSDKGQFHHFNLRKLKAMMKSPAALIDLVGLFEPVQINTEGFVYAGLGRGTDQK